MAVVDEDAAGLGIVKAGDELHHGRFAGAGGSDEGDDFSGSDGKGNIVEHGMKKRRLGAHGKRIGGRIGEIIKSGIGEGDVFQLDRALHVRDADGVRFFLHIGFDVEDFKDARRWRPANYAEDRIHFGDAVDGQIQLRDQVSEGDDGSAGGVAVIEAIAAVPDKGECGHLCEPLDDGIGEGGGFDVDHGEMKKSAGTGEKGAGFTLFTGKSLNDVDAGDAFLDVTGKLFHGFLDGAGGFLGFSAQRFHAVNVQRKHQQRGEGERHVHRKKHDEIEDAGGEIHPDVGHGVADEILSQRNVGHEAGDDAAGLARGEKRMAHPRDVLVEIGAQVEHDAVPGELREVTAEINADAPDGVEHDEGKHEDGEGRTRRKPGEPCQAAGNWALSHSV